MLQNKIYQNFTIEIFKTFLIILFGLSMVALTVRAVGFLELIVESGYPVLTYFSYSLLNLFGITTKFIPFSFFLALTVFVVKHSDNSEFSILWSSGVKKIKIVNLFFLVSILIMILNLLFSTFLTPLALNKSRQLLSSDQFNSFLPAVKEKQFSDTFRGFTLIVEKKNGNRIENIFVHDKNNSLKNLSSNSVNTSSTTIIAKNGILRLRGMTLLEGEIISSKIDSGKNEIINFEQLNINFDDLSTSTIKKPKLQELQTAKLLTCFKSSVDKKFCNENFIQEIISNLNRRIILPFYIPIISLICSFLLLKNEKTVFKKIAVYSACIFLIIFAEIAIKYTGINNYMLMLFVTLPFLLIIFFYLLLSLKFSKEF
tara:strand:+ start:444 stop:1556 length:1113 start_codon:yes stop_codon:yes gene_type:complete